MSAILCGKRSFFDELAATSSAPVSKKLRCSSSTSPVRFSTSFTKGVLVDRLREVFPLMDQQLIEKALEECGQDTDAAIKRLHELCLGSSKEYSGSVNHMEARVEQGGLVADEQALPTADPHSQNTIPTDGTQWVELFVREMTSATSVDHARANAARLLEVLEKSIRAQVSTEGAENYPKENIMLKQQIEALMHDNSILKRGIQIQRERQKEYDDKNQEVQQLKQLVYQYQEQLRRLEVTNYALSVHLKQAQPSNSIPGHFHPDIF